MLTAALPLFGAPPGGPYLGALDAAGVAAILTAWRGGRPQPSPLTWPAAAFVAVSLLTLIPSPYLPPSWQPSILVALLRSLPGVPGWTALYTWRAAADLLLGWGLFLAVRRAFAGRSPMPLALALLVGLSVTLFLGLGSMVELINLRAYRPRHSNRLYSVFFLAAWLAEYIVAVTPLAVAAVTRYRDRLGRLLLPLLGITLFCLVLTRQRGAWIAAACQLLLWAALTAPRWRQRPAALRQVGKLVVILVLVSAVLLSLFNLLGPVLERVRSMPSGLTTRMPLWAAAVEMARERPLLGWGLGSYTPAYDLLHPRGSPQARGFRGTAHNLYLNVLAGRGAVGLLALGLLGWAAVSCLRRPRAGEETLALALGVSLIGIAVYSLVQYFFHVRNLAWLFWILMGCVALVGRPENRPRLSRWALGLTLCGLLLVPVRLWFDEPPSFAGSRAFGLHEAEVDLVGEYRWTEGFAAERLPWAGETLVLGLANGHPRASQRPVTVTLSVDGEIVKSLTLTGGWVEERIDVGPPRKESILLTIRAEPTFRPFEDYLPYEEIVNTNDIRLLGVAVRRPRWESPTDAIGTQDAVG